MDQRMMVYPAPPIILVCQVTGVQQKRNFQTFQNQTDPVGVQGEYIISKNKNIELFYQIYQI